MSDDIKKRMAVPPIPQQAPRSHRSRNRNRIRMEVTPEQCAVFVTMLGDRLKAMTVEDPDFKVLYTTYSMMKQQMDKVAK